MDRGGLRGLFLLLPKKYSFSKVRLLYHPSNASFFFSLHSSSKFFVVELLYELKAQCRRRRSIVSARYSNENDEGHDTQFVSDGPDRSRRDVPNGKV